MALEKAIIQPLDEKLNSMGQAIDVLFNPSEYSIEKSNQYQGTSLPGLSAPIFHFVNGNAQTLSMDLFFDTYELGKDVRDYTSKITSLLDINSDLHAPPVCMFIWGSLVFRAIIEKVTQKFTMFLDSGIPVRAVLSVSFKEYKTISEQLESIPRFSADRTKHRQIKQGDNLWLIADREYGSPAHWKHIARANNIDNPRELEIGKEIVLPPLE